jgi:hypothetical protein
MKETGRKRKRKMDVDNLKERIHPGALRKLRKTPSQGVTRVLLHPLTYIEIGMFVAIMIDCGKNMMNFEGMPKGNRGYEHQSQ